MDGVPEEPNSGKEILENKAKRDDIELESLDGKSMYGLWNTPESRAVFYEIVKSKCRVKFAVLRGVTILHLTLFCR